MQEQSVGLDANKLRSLQAMRGIAAWLVVTMHLFQFAARFSPDDRLFSTITKVVVSFGHAGVDLFFVISGVIMYLIASQPKASNRYGEASNFLLRRAARVFPLFWVTLIFALVLGVGFWPPSYWDMIPNLLLYSMPPEHPVSWTLVFEVRFYLLVTVCIVLFHQRMEIGMAACAATIVALVYLPSLGIEIPDWFSTNLMLEFVFGICVGAAFKRKINFGARTALCAGVLLFIATSLRLFWTPGLVVDAVRVFGYGAAAAMVLYGCLSLERVGLHFPNWLVSLGDESYSIYMWHYLVAWVLAASWTIKDRAGAAIFILTAVVLTITISRASYRNIERRISWRARPIIHPSITSTQMYAAPTGRQGVVY